ncbi:unnamed protein product [Polarella glacialis]|uniref:Uncharacterized protein n=1 Tax=Polarella glacialis TaxID=89957 RepID=A0A813KNW7_POLGL|nr:unnamed protein product [Polarella glacialis]
MVAVPRYELLVTVVALVVQAIYGQLYDAYSSGMSEVFSLARLALWGDGVGELQTSAGSADSELVMQVSEFLSGDCQGPPARLWHLRPGPEGRDHSEPKAL